MRSRLPQLLSQAEMGSYGLAWGLCDSLTRKRRRSRWSHGGQEAPPAAQPTRWRSLSLYVGPQAQEPAQAGKRFQADSLAGAPGGDRVGVLEHQHRQIDRDARIPCAPDPSRPGQPVDVVDVVIEASRWPMNVADPYGRA